MTFADDKCDPVKGEVTEDFTASMQQPKVSVRYMFSGRDALHAQEQRLRP